MRNVLRHKSKPVTPPISESVQFAFRHTPRRSRRNLDSAMLGARGAGMRKFATNRCPVTPELEQTQLFSEFLFVTAVDDFVPACCVRRFAVRPPSPEAGFASSPALNFFLRVDGAFDDGD